MATQTPTQRQASAKRAAATRKRNAAKRSASTTRASARRTSSAASGTARNARRTARTAGTTTNRAAETAVRSFDAAGSQLGVVGRHAQRALLIPVGAAVAAGDAVKRIALKYTDSTRRARQLDQFELRGARTLNRGRRKVVGRAR
jgi:hypothetical protein